MVSEPSNALNRFELALADRRPSNSQRFFSIFSWLFSNAVRCLLFINAVLVIGLKPLLNPVITHHNASRPRACFSFSASLAITAVPDSALRQAKRGLTDSTLNAGGIEYSCH
ncbi:MAG: hypothetical protein EBY55_04600 [Gammaproteobacteria bacterium]|nr:hypothetical protein [Gammaproteobacteria bacterium]